MADSDSSSLSSAPSTDDEAMLEKMTKPTGLNRYFKPAPKPAKEPTPEPPKRAPSPPHEYVLADNDAIAFLVMFRSRFSDAFPKSLPHYGPQDIEKGVSGELPDEQVERYLCALLGLVLNRKKDVERGHYGRALEDAISTHQNQWPTSWHGVNPLHGGKSFNSMSAEERLVLLKTLVLWSLNASEIVSTMIKDSYKQTRRDDDKNQPRSVQPWFSDAYRRKYWLIEGQDDSYFRVYRENDGKTTKTNTWFSVAGTIEDINALADKFAEEATVNSKINSERLKSAIPRFEVGDEKRKRRDYRIARKAAFTRPEPGFSLYEGRTRGKRMKYTYSDEEDASDSRRSGVSTPFESGPTITASGRHVKVRHGGVYGESMLVDQRKEFDKISGEDDGVESDDEMPGTAPNGRPMRASRSSNNPKAARESYRQSLGSDGSDNGQSTNNEWSGDEEEPDASEPDFDAEDEDENDEMSDEDPELDEADDLIDPQESLVVQLRYRKSKVPEPGGVQSMSSTSPKNKHQTNGTDPQASITKNGHAPSISTSETHSTSPMSNGVDSTTTAYEGIDQQMSFRPSHAKIGDQGAQSLTPDTKQITNLVGSSKGPQLQETSPATQGSNGLHKASQVQPQPMDVS